METGAKAPAEVAKPVMSSQSKTYLVSLALLVLVLLAWQFLPPALGVPKFIIPTVTDCLIEMKRMLLQEGLVGHTLSTALYTVLGFAIGSLLGAVIGYLLGMSEFWEKVLSPYILALQIAPKVAFAPLFIMWFGYNAMPKLLVTVLIVFFPVLVNVLQAMKTVDRDIINLARAYNLTRWQIFRKIEFPSTLPSLLAGLRIGSTLAVIGVTLGFLLTGIPFGFMALLGFLSLSGMLVKNGIVLVDEIRLQIDSGKEAYSALVDSAISRVRPVSMAALTTILGMAPLLTDAFFQSMAVVIMFGLGFATVLTLVVLPVIYSLFFKIPVEGRRV